MPRLRASLLAVASLTALSACATPSAPESASDAESMLMADYLSGRYADMTNDPAGASAHYLSALRQSPADSVLLDGAIESALIAGDMARATEAAEMARTQGADVSLGKLTLATAALKAGKSSVARGFTDTAAGPPFDRQAARVLRAWSLAQENKTDQALAVFADIAASAPFAGVFDYQRAMILERAGRNDEAIKTYEGAINAGMRISPTLASYGALLERTGQKDKALTLYKRLLDEGDDALIAAALGFATLAASSLSRALATWYSFS